MGTGAATPRLRCLLAIFLALSCAVAAAEGSDATEEVLLKVRAAAAASSSSKKPSSKKPSSKKPSAKELAQAEQEYAAKLKARYESGVKAKKTALEKNMTSNKAHLAAKKPVAKFKKPVKVLKGGNPDPEKELRKLRAKVDAVKKKWTKTEGKPVRRLLGEGAHAPTLEPGERGAGGEGLAETQCHCREKGLLPDLSPQHQSLSLPSRCRCSFRLSL